MPVPTLTQGCDYTKTAGVNIMLGFFYLTDWEKEEHGQQHVYQFTDDLLALNRCVPVGVVMPAEWRGICTPFVLEEWEKALRGHPDQRFARYIISGIREGFRIGFDYATHSCVPARRNMLSTQRSSATTLTRR